MSKSKKDRSKTANAKNVSRRLFVIDIENFCGKPVLDESDISSAKKFFCKNFKPESNDLILIGTSHTNNFLSVGMTWNEARQVFGKGHDGADLALIDAIKDYKIDTFEEIVIMSGDGIFAESVDEIAAQGVIVTVVSIARCLSKKLANVAPAIKIINNPLAA